MSNPDIAPPNIAPANIAPPNVPPVEIAPPDPAALDRITLRRLVQLALDEDGANQDLTTNALVPPDQLGRARIVAKQSGVICGLSFGQETYHVVEPRVQWMAAVIEGMEIAAGATIAHLAGPIHPMLRGERVVLNYLQRLSGIATLTREAVQRVAHTEAKILDTRKTSPGLRVAERYAVRVGGGLNHRFNLHAGLLVKDNHIAAVRARGGSLADATRAALAAAGPATAVEIEVTSLDEVDEALATGARALLLDNLSPHAMAQAVARARQARALTEASGNITLDNVAAVAESGVDFISLGALTHSAPALDLSMRIEPESDVDVRPT